MEQGKKLSHEAKFLIREYALHVMRKRHPNSLVEVEIGDYVNEDGKVERTVRVLPKTAVES